MAADVVRTPNRPVPGSYLQTPAQGPNLRPGQSQPPVFQPNLPQKPQQNGIQTQNQALSQSTQQASQSSGKQTAEYIKPVQRASKTINELLVRESHYPELDSYVGRT